MVENEGDMIGHIAYSLYQDDEIQYVRNYKIKHGGDDIPAEKLNQYKEIIEDNSIKHYRERANQILLDFLQESFDVTSKEFVEKVNKEISEQIKKDMVPRLPKTESLGKRLLVGSLQSMGGALIMYFFIWFFANVVGKYEIGNFSVEYKDNNKSAQQEQVVQPKDSLP